MGIKCCGERLCRLGKWLYSRFLGSQKDIATELVSGPSHRIYLDIMWMVCGTSIGLIIVSLASSFKHIC